MQEKILYLECYSGISGDMTVGALLDLGADAGYLREELRKLPVDGYELKFGRRLVRGIDAFDFDVMLEESHCHHEDAHIHRPGHHHRTMG